MKKVGVEVVNKPYLYWYVNDGIVGTYLHHSPQCLSENVPGSSK